MVIKKIIFFGAKFAYARRARRDECFAGLARLAEECWRDQPSLRPSASHIVHALGDIFGVKATSSNATMTAARHTARMHDEPHAVTEYVDGDHSNPSPTDAYDKPGAPVDYAVDFASDTYDSVPVEPDKAPVGVRVLYDIVDDDDA